jgi:hypothetical protein
LFYPVGGSMANGALLMQCPSADTPCIAVRFAGPPRRRTYAFVAHAPRARAAGLIGLLQAPMRPPHSPHRARSVHWVHGSEVPPSGARTDVHMARGEETPRCTAARPPHPTATAVAGAPQRGGGRPWGNWNPAELAASKAAGPTRPV